MHITREELAFGNDIRGGPFKSMGRTLSTTFAKREPLDSSSGDLPPLLGNNTFACIKLAFQETPGTAMSYNNPLYRHSQDSIWKYLTGLDPKVMDSEFARVLPIPGISPFMRDAIDAAAYALGFPKETRHLNSPVFVIIPPIHPHWLGSIIENFGFASIRTIKRTSDGFPDLEDMGKVFKSIDKPFIVIACPDENPAGVCTPNKYLFNKEGTGLINRIRGIEQLGILLLDTIYMDLAWGPESGKRQELVKAVDEEGVRAIIMHSLSKVFKLPGMRIGGAAYVGPIKERTNDVALRLLSRLKMIADGNIKNGISAPALAALIEAYSGREEIQKDIERTINEVRKRVESNDEIMCGGDSSIISKFYPDSTINAAFYGLYNISSGGAALPWHNTVYRQWLIDTIEERLDFSNLDNELAWRLFRSLVAGAKGMTADQAFSTELAMNGIMTLSGGQFWPMFQDDALQRTVITDSQEERVTVRTILARTNEDTELTKRTIEELVKTRALEYGRGEWKKTYQQAA